MLYAGYGSNLNRIQMEERCPNSERIAAKILKNWRLCFRGVADIVPDNGFFVNLGIYKITKKCERALDYYEDFPNLYTKKYLKLDEFTEPVLTYVMKPGYGLGPPSIPYFETIFKGYIDWELESSCLFEAASFALSESTDFSYKSIRWSGFDHINDQYLRSIIRK